MKKNFISKRAGALALATFMATNAVPVVGLANDNLLIASATQIDTISNTVGLDNVATPSQANIIAKYKAIGTDTSSFATAPNYSTSTPYTSSDTGTLSNDALENSLDTYNFIRYITGISHDTTTIDAYNTYAQDASFAMGVHGNITHYPAWEFPEKETSFSSDLWTSIVDGAKANLASGQKDIADSLLHGWMADDDEGNIDVVGHRRNMLNPMVTTTGFGFINNATGDNNKYGGKFSAHYIDSNKTSSTNVQGVAWPAQNTPVEYFENNYPWSYSSYDKTKVFPTDGSGVEVVLTRTTGEADSWTFDNTNTNFNNDYMNVDSVYKDYASGSWSLNSGNDEGCVIFRPLGITYSAGDVFNVEITVNNVVWANYDVNFFELDGATPPSITENLEATISYMKDATATALSITATGTALTYQWYKDGKAISGATSSSYTPVTDTLGTSTYYCIVTATESNGKTATTKSNTTTVTVSDMDAIVFEKDLIQGTVTYTQGDSATALSLSVKERTDEAELTYDWYKDDVKIDKTINNAAYTPSTETIGTSTYYCIVTATLDGTSVTAQSKTVTVTVEEATIEKPFISTDLDTAVVPYTEGDTADALTIVVADLKETDEKGQLSYQWYKNDDAISEATGLSYTPTTTTDDIGTTEYYCKVTNTATVNGTQYTTVVSSAKAQIKVEALEADEPTITTDLSTTPIKYVQNDIATALTIVAETEDGGDLTYQWFNGDDEEISGAEENTYTPPTDKLGKTQYYCVVTNTVTNGDATATADTTSSMIEFVVAPEHATAPTITTDLSTTPIDYAQNNIATALEIVAETEDGGDLTYQWYEMDVVVEDDTTEENEGSGESEENEGSGESGENEGSGESEENEGSGESEENEGSGESGENEGSGESGENEGSGEENNGILVRAINLSNDTTELTGTAIAGETDATFTPPTDTIGTKQYYCVVTNTNDDAFTTQTAETTSGIATVVVRLANAEAPAFTTNLDTDDVWYDLDDEAVEIKALTVEATVTDGGELSYQWYKNGEEIEGETEASYTPEANVGMHLYHCVVTNTNTEAVNPTTEAKSNVVRVLMTDATFQIAETPNITTNLTEETVVYVLNDAEAEVLDLEVEATVSDGGTISYQWSVNGEEIEGATETTYTPDISAVGTFIYLCEITNTNSSIEEGAGIPTNSVWSHATTIEVVSPESANTPVFSHNLDTDSVTYTKGDEAENLIVKAVVSDGGTISYQWYKDGELIEDAQGDTYTPDTDETGTFEYYCIATNKNIDADNWVASTKSNIATIIVKSASSSGGSSSGGTSSGGGGSSSSGSSSSSSNVTGTVTVTPSTTNTPAVTIVTMRPTVSNQTISVSISDSTIKSAVESAIKNSTDSLKAGIEIQLNTTSTAVVNKIEVALSKESQEMILNADIPSVNIVSGEVSLSLDLNTLKEVNRVLGDDVKISAVKQDITAVPSALREVVGNRPIFDFSIVDTATNTSLSEFGTGKVTVSIPYTLGAGEQASGLVLYYIDDKGGTEKIPASYNASTKTLSFAVDHFSVFAIAYEPSETTSTTFADIQNHWGKEQIEAMVELGLFSGTSATTFSPDLEVTRGMFITVLGRLSGVDFNAYKESSFEDVDNNMYYMAYIEWGKEQGVVSGMSATEFAPEEHITREQMALMLSNYARTQNVALPQNGTDDTFADDTAISSWAKDAVYEIKEAGIISGKGENQFDPQGKGTRAEFASMLNRFLK